MRGSVSDPCGGDVVRERVSGLGRFAEVVGSPLWNPGWVGGLGPEQRAWVCVTCWAQVVSGLVDVVGEGKKNLGGESVWEHYARSWFVVVSGL